MGTPGDCSEKERKAFPREATEACFRSCQASGCQIAYATQRPLYSFKPGQEDPPDSAASRPQISGDIETITVKIRRGVTFSPPVNREVTSRDAKYAFERFFSLKGRPHPGAERRRRR
jgi:ABC-type transport system substrate-binding protein